MQANSELRSWAIRERVYRNQRVPLSASTPWKYGECKLCLWTWVNDEPEQHDKNCPLSEDSPNAG